MRKITAYKTINVSSLGADYFDKVVTDNLKEGWELYGNPSFNSRGFFQAMVKYEPSESVLCKHEFIIKDLLPGVVSNEELPHGICRKCGYEP